MTPSLQDQIDELRRRLDALTPSIDATSPLTVNEYAKRHHRSPEAIYSRIRRGTFGSKIMKVDGNWVIYDDE